jgi:hypothetical protein
MGVRSILRAAQQSLPKKLSAVFSSEFSGSSISGDTTSSSSKRNWSFMSGTWGISSSKLTTSTAASSHPIMVVDALVPDVSVELKDIGQGIGAAIWVTDSGNWWAAAPQQTTEDCNCSTTGYSCGCSTCTGSYCSSYSCGCGNGNYTPASGGGCSGYSCSTAYGNYCSSYYANGNCSGYTVVSWQNCSCSSYAPYNSGNYSPESYSCCCSASYQYSCNCSTCYSTTCQTCYPQYMRIIQSAANTVSEILKWQISSVVQSIKVMTSNKTITVKSYSDAALQTEVNSQDYTATNAQETTMFGVVVSPSSYNQSGTISEINIERGV